MVSSAIERLSSSPEMNPAAPFRKPVRVSVSVKTIREGTDIPRSSTNCAARCFASLCFWNPWPSDYALVPIRTSPSGSLLFVLLLGPSRPPSPRHEKERLLIKMDFRWRASDEAVAVDKLQCQKQGD
ncbi:hypothetical protein KC341_g26 [Hortaea werneckii]|nr:hypothetical protein KC341_g26 [Hortaea werneckii]